MAIIQLERPPASPAGEPALEPGLGSGLESGLGSGLEPGLAGLVAGIEEALSLAGGLPTEGLDDEALGQVVAALARVESRAAALRMGLSAVADRRRVAEQTGETGTDVWVARLTGSTREAAAGGLRLARLLAEK